ncbi:MAG: MucB/RseB C-terminal domain-containing protein [Proteobacteria bacterium]|nr:MucB/RseB C-terminal domain-containing protein [Pseudomonadota bacterium]
MLSRPLSLLALVGAACVYPAVAAAAGPTAPAAAPQRPDVHTWLARIHDAASRHNFQGTLVVTGSAGVSSARIAHYCEGRNQFERSESLDGQARRMFRHNEVVYTFWPDSRVAVVEQREATANFPALLQDGGDQLSAYYELRAQGTDRVAGHDADVLLVLPRDAYRYGYRLWSDRATNLLLRADVLGRQSEVLETSAFSDLQIDVRPQPESVLQPMRKLDGYHVVRPTLTPARLEAEGWTLDHPVAGFRQISCVRRPMDGSSVGLNEGSTDQVLQAIYSDGLTYVSVFIEPYDAQRHQRETSGSAGATQTLSLRRGDWWLTIVGDVPPSTLRLFADALERKK